MKLQKLLVIALVSMFLLSIGAAFKPAYAATNFTATPASVIWGTDAHPYPPASTFVVDFWINEVADLAGYEFKIYWKNTVLTTTAQVKTHPFPGSPFEATWEVSPNFNATHGRIYWVIASMAGSVTGSFKLLSMTFQTVAAPPAVIGGFIDTNIDMTEDIFGDSGAGQIPHTTNDGYFRYNYIAPAPPTITAGSKTLAAPGTFDLPVTIAAYASVYALTSVHFVMTYNDALLHATGATAGTWGGLVTTAIVAGQITVDVSGVVPVGSSGVIVNIQFNGYYDPGPGNSASCPLVLTAANFNGGSAFSAVNNGLYTIAIPSLALKAISISPAVYTATDEGEIFTVDVVVHNITSVDKLFGVQFTFSYDPTLLDVLAVSEGPFLPSFPWTIPSTYFFVYPGIGTFTVATGLIGGGSEPPGYVYPFTVEPAGGVIAHVTFKTLLGIPGDTVGCPLVLSDPVFGNVEGIEIPVGLIHDAQYYLTLDKRYIDIYTDYPDPFGGQRRNQDADAYQPQQEVCVNALVTYNRWPVQNKPVNFEIHGPANPIYNITLYRVAFTDANGIARICFRIDWPCEFPEEIAFGTWTVIGSVDLDEIVVTDILHFEVGWFITITKITLNEDAYRHGWHTTVTLDYISISHQNRMAFFTETFYDDAGYGLGSLTFTKMVSYGPGTVTMTCFAIPKWARAGIGTVYADAYTAAPSLGGVAYCPEVAKTFIILAA